MIYHISRVSQPTNTVQIKKKELFAFIAHNVMHAMQFSDFIQCSLFDMLFLDEERQKLGYEEENLRTRATVRINNELNPH